MSEKYKQIVTPEQEKLKRLKHAIRYNGRLEIDTAQFLKEYFTIKGKHPRDLSLNIEKVSFAFPSKLYYDGKAKLTSKRIALTHFISVCIGAFILEVPEFMEFFNKYMKKNYGFKVENLAKTWVIPEVEQTTVDFEHTDIKEEVEL